MLLQWVSREIEFIPRLAESISVSCFALPQGMNIMCQHVHPAEVCSHGDRWPLRMHGLRSSMSFSKRPCSSQGTPLWAAREALEKQWSPLPGETIESPS